MHWKISIFYWKNSGQVFLHFPPKFFDSFQSGNAKYILGLWKSSKKAQIWKKSLYLYFKKFIDIFIFIYFINKFCAIFLPRPGHQGQAQEHPDRPGEGLAHGCCTVGVPSRKACRALVGGLGAQARARARMITPAALITFHKLVVHLTSIVGEVSTFTFRDCLIFMFSRLSNFSFH